MNKRSLLSIFLLVATSVITACNHSNPADTNIQKNLRERPTPPAVVVPPTSYADTLFVQDAFASQPFQLDSVSVPAVLALFGTHQLVKKPITNKFDKEQTDTLVTIRKAHSYIQLYAVSSEDKKYFYKVAIIQDSLPVFSQKLQIGQSKDRVKQIIKPLAQESQLPDIIQISNEEGTDYVYLVFRNNKLAAVKVQPYLD